MQHGMQEMSKVSKVAPRNLDDAIREAMDAPYRRELVQNSDGTWFAKIVELPGCMTEGDTEAEALENLSDAMREWLRVQIEDGDAIPQPWADAQYSGKFLVRVPPSLHRDIAERAAREGVSLNAFVLTALARAVGGSDHIARQLQPAAQISIAQVFVQQTPPAFFAFSALALGSNVGSTLAATPIT
jgi:antitoxin HicB